MEWGPGRFGEGTYCGGVIERVSGVGGAGTWSYGAGEIGPEVVAEGGEASGK